MQDNNKAVTAFVRSMKRGLKERHGVDVSYAALRACFLEAQGENPHAFAGKHRQSEGPVASAAVGEFPVPKGYALVPLRLNWEMEEVVNEEGWQWEDLLAAAGAITEQQYSEIAAADGDEVGSAQAEEADMVEHSLYLVGDEDGCLTRLSLDVGGCYQLGERFIFDAAELVHQTAQLPRVSKYGFPDYYEKPSEFFGSHFGLTLAKDYKSCFLDLGDDCADTCHVRVRLPEVKWVHLVAAVLGENPTLEDEVGEWLGVHHLRHFPTMTAAKRADWVERYLEANC